MTTEYIARIAHEPATGSVERAGSPAEGPESAAPGAPVEGAENAEGAESAGNAESAAPAPVRFDTKIAVLLRDDLAPWQRLNATAFLVSGLGSALPEVIGKPYEDADGTPYLPMFRQPVLVFEGSKEVMERALDRTLSRALPRAVFTADLFSTGHDADNRAAVRAVPRAGLDLVGLAVHGPRNAVDKVLKGARMHP